MHSSERRRFSRVPFQGTLLLQQGSQVWPAALVDISLQGILLQLSDLRRDPPDTAQPLSASLQLAETAVIVMELQFTRHAGSTWALSITAIDVDSISHLRRLIELNLGDARACERELSELLDHVD